MWVKRSDWKHFEKIKETAKLQNTPQLICNMLNDNSTYCFIPRSSKSSDTLFTGFTESNFYKN